MIPIGDENPRRSLPLITWLFILTNIAIFVYQAFLGAKGFQFYVASFGLIPYELTRFTDLPPTSLLRFPALNAFSSIFMHGGIAHLLTNMLFMWIFADNVEDRLGRRRFFVFYMLCGLVACGVHAGMNPSSKMPLVGASGAISGVMGAYMMMFPLASVITIVPILIFPIFVRIPAIIFVGIWFLTQLLFAQLERTVAPMSNVAWYAHIGGFVCGVVLILLMKKKR